MGNESINIIRKFVASINDSMYNASWRTLPKICSAAGFAHMFDLLDDTSNTKKGYWFYEDPRNTFKSTGEKERSGSNQTKERRDSIESWIFQGIIEQLTDSPSADDGPDEWQIKLTHQAELFISESIDPDLDIPDPEDLERADKKLSSEQIEAFEEKLREIQQIELNLLCLVLLTLPGPIPNLNDITYVNTATKQRNLIILNNRVVIIDDDGLHRRLPWFIGELIVRYLTVFRPLQRLLSRYIYDDQNSKMFKGRLGTYLTVHNWPQEQLEPVCSQILDYFDDDDEQESGIDYGFKAWRETFVNTNVDFYESKYKKWLDMEELPTEQELYIFHQRFELASQLAQLGVELCTQVYARSTILPYSSYGAGL